MSETRVRRSGVHAPAHRVFFFLACVQAVIAVPWWWAEWAGWLPAGPAANGMRHAHEMLFGFALAVMGGFLLTALSQRMLALAAATWLAGRLATVLGIGGWIEAVSALAFPALLALLAGIPFLRSARSGHNLVFAPVMFGFLASEALYQAGRAGLVAGGDERAIWLAFDLVMLMLLVMAGRILPAAMAGLVRRTGGELVNRNRPTLERAETAGMGLAIAVHALALPELLAWAGWIVAGSAALLRQTRWRPLLSIRQPDLWPLQLGHLWLGGGLMAAGLSGVAGSTAFPALLHAATIGGLGTITATMMIRTIMLRDRILQRFPRTILATIILLSIAAALRLMGLTGASAIVWSAAFLAVGWELLKSWRARVEKARYSSHSPL